jgi:hypothetical protein
MMVYENEMACPSVRKWTKTKGKLAYEEAEPFLYYLDKYATVLVGGARSMAKYLKNHNGNTLLDRLTPSDIAYSVLLYESAHDMWKEEIHKCETCQTIQEKKEFQHTASLKYHVKRGTKIALFQDGWTQEGRAYFSSLCQVFDELKKSNKIWSSLQDHWKTYTKKYHMMGVEESIHNNDFGKVDCGDEEESNDDDCMVLFPGEETGEKTSNFKEAVESDSDDDRVRNWMRKKSTAALKHWVHSTRD